MTGEDHPGELDRRELLVRGTGALLAAGLAGGLVSRAAAAGLRTNAAGRPAGPRPVDSVVLNTVTGPIRGSDVTFALAHEHLFVDFLGPTEPAYMDVNWSEVTEACVASVNVLRGQGVNLLADWTNLGVGRAPLLLRDVSRQTGMNILMPTGIYKSLYPPEYAGMTVAEIAE